MKGLRMPLVDDSKRVCSIPISSEAVLRPTAVILLRKTQV